MKTKSFVFAFLLICTIMPACSLNIPHDITMPYSSEEYENGDWTGKELVKHFEELGFNDITEIREPSYFSDYENEIINVDIALDVWQTDSIFTEYANFEKGDVINSNNEVQLEYYYVPEALSIDNCPDLTEILFGNENGELMNYMTFANKYNGEYVRFDAYVYSRNDYWEDNDPIINVAGGDYSENGTKGHIIYIGDRTLDAEIDKTVSKGQLVKVYGKIDASWSEYYETIYVETLAMKPR